MKYVDEYRDPDTAQGYAALLRGIVTRPWTLMEICGGQTHSIVKHGIDELLPREIELVHGPGCPVCVTPLEKVEKALEIAATPGVIFCSFGDMLRVPGETRDLLSVRAAGGDVRIVYSPLDAVKLAVANPESEVVFFAVGFETTAPANALAVRQAKALGLRNFTLLVSHVLVPPAMEAILSAPGNRVQGFLAAGHVCAVMGHEEYTPISLRYRVPIVVTGFEPVDILQGIYMCVRQLESGRAEVENQYARVVRPSGNPGARELINEVFTIVSRSWRGIGSISASGLAFRPEYESFDAERRFGVLDRICAEPAECIAGLILQGVKKPFDCEAFGTRCTPERPLGATMVSSEGACAAYYKWRAHSATGSLGQVGNGD